jgi:hypothetical protein
MIDRSGSASWWAAMEDTIKNLTDLMREQGNTLDKGDLWDIAVHAPRLLWKAGKLETERNTLMKELKELNVLVVSSRDKSGGVAHVIAGATEAIALIRGYQRRLSNLTTEAYDRELGGSD